MYDPQMPISEHTEFEILCQGVEDYETLPELHPRPTRPMESHEADLDTLDTEILHGLISP